jgi:hypothetical protein
MEKLTSQLQSLNNQFQTVGKDYSNSNPPENRRQILIGSTPELNTQIAIIQKAWRSPLLAEVNDAELAQRLSLIYFTIGLRPHHFPTKEEDFILFAYIRKKYGFRTLDELYLAFDLAINEKLDVDDVKVYDQFSIEYLVRILNAYGRYVYNAMKQIKRAAPEAEPVTITEEEKRADIEEFMNAVEVKIMPLYLYEWLDELGYLTYTDEERVRLYSRAINYRVMDLELRLTKNPGEKQIKIELDRLRENIRSGFRNATNPELSLIQNEYKRAVLFDQKMKRKSHE